jgi:hypothetical protein
VTESETAPTNNVESAAASVLDISAPELAPDTVVAAEGTTGVEAKLPDTTTASDISDSNPEEKSGFLQLHATEKKAQ